MGEHAGLARAGAGEHQQRPLAVLDGLALGRVQVGEQALDRGRRPALIGRAESRRRRLARCRSRLEDRAATLAGAELATGLERRQPAVELSRRRCSGPASAAARVTSVLGGVSPASVGEPPLDLADALGEPLDRVGDRVGEVDPVGVGALGLAALDPDGVAGVADHGRVRRDVVDHDRVGADLGAVADRDRAEQLRPGADRDVVLERRVALAALRSRCRRGSRPGRGSRGRRSRPSRRSRRRSRGR